MICRVPVFIIIDVRIGQLHTQSPNPLYVVLETIAY